MKLIFLAIVVCLYFLPTIIAWRKNHLNIGVIFMINLIWGWTSIGWIAALIWACKPAWQIKWLARPSYVMGHRAAEFKTFVKNAARVEPRF